MRGLKIILFDPAFAMTAAYGDAAIFKAIAEHSNIDAAARQHAADTEQSIDRSCAKLIEAGVARGAASALIEAAE